MAFYEREEKIISALMENGGMSIRELSGKLFVSMPTLRRDLIKLEQMGKIIRTHGGAQLLTKPADENIPFFLREQEQNDAKVIVAQKAAAFVQDGDIVMMDGSTSAYSVVPYLTGLPNLVVITSSAQTSFLLGKLGIHNICTGGRMITKSLCYVGEDAERTVRSYNADIVFFSCRGVSSEGKLTDRSTEENRLRRAMLQQSRKRILLCDSSKIGNTYLNTLCHLSEVDEILCETDVPENLAEMVRSRQQK